MRGNLIEQKSFDFAVRIYNLYKHLRETKQEYILSNQILRSGTSIGANVSEAEQAISRADFKSKLNIALKEASETEYWIRLLYAAKVLDQVEYKSIYDDCVELERILVTIIRTMNTK